MLWQRKKRLNYKWYNYIGTSIELWNKYSILCINNSFIEKWNLKKKIKKKNCRKSAEMSAENDRLLCFPLT